MFCFSSDERRQAKSEDFSRNEKTGRHPFLVLACFVSLPVLIGLCNCSTTADTVVATGEEERVIAACNEADLVILDYRFSKDRLLADRARGIIKEQLEKKLVNKDLLARIYGIQGMLDLELGNRQTLRNYIDTIESLSSKEERLYLLKAALEQSEAGKVKILETGLTQSAPGARIHLALAEIYNKLGDYEKAGARYDEAFVSLDPKYGEYYKNSRDTAYQLMASHGNFEGVKQILARDTLTVGDMLVAIHKSTRFLSNMAQNKSSNSQALFDVCMKNKYLNPAVTGPDTVLSRKDAAFFFLAILMYQENNKSLATKYSSTYSRTNKTSPVPDIKVTDYYFDAALVLVEREILELPDGINFFPDNTVSGQDLGEILKCLLRSYNY